MNCGNVYYFKTTTSYELNSIYDIKTILIPLFENFPLNWVKFLDYLSFKKAIELKENDQLSKDKKLELIRELKNSMNTKRIDFSMPKSHNINITPYWLLGLIEGEGSFCLMNSKTFVVCFCISLIAPQAPLIEAIKEYLGALLIKNSNIKFFTSHEATGAEVESSQIILKKIFYINHREKRLENAEASLALSIRHIQFLAEEFIPMLQNLCFLTKKHKDFLDWAFIVSLIHAGKHTTDAGKNLILQISKGMNNKHLSTYKQIDKLEINPKLIDEVLNMEDKTKKV